MKYALINPNWTFRGSIYFGCKDPHVPLELLYAHDQIQEAGHDVEVIDAQLDNLNVEEVRLRVRRLQPDFVVMPTAPSYLFWRCPPPELRVPQVWFAAITGKSIGVAIGPHPSATPRSAMNKIGCQVALRGEPEFAVAQLSNRPWKEIEGCCWRSETGEHISSTTAVVDMHRLRALDFQNYHVEAHAHRHHVFYGSGRGAELEFARGCPWSCTFCNKTLFRSQFRERPVGAVLEEVDRLRARGVDYIYFIDEIFGVGRNACALLEGLAARAVTIGLQTRIDIWDEASLDLLADAHCISMECGIESITEKGRRQLSKNCRLGTERLAELLIYARRRIPWVQANLILTAHDDRDQIRAWQTKLKEKGVWVSEPVPMFPYPGTPLYLQIFGGPPDDQAWERAHRYYVSTFGRGGYSDIQEQRPVSIEELECAY